MGGLRHEMRSTYWTFPDLRRRWPVSRCDRRLLEQGAVLIGGGQRQWILCDHRPLHRAVDRHLQLQNGVRGLLGQTARPKTVRPSAWVASPDDLAAVDTGHPVDCCQLPLLAGVPAKGWWIAGWLVGTGDAHGAETHITVGLEIALLVASIIVSLTGTYLAYRFYVQKPEAWSACAKRLSFFHKLADNGYYFDAAYDWLRNGLWVIARWLSETFDAGIIDRAVNGIARGTGAVGAWTARPANRSGRHLRVDAFRWLVVVLGYFLLTALLEMTIKLWTFPGFRLSSSSRCWAVCCCCCCGEKLLKSTAIVVSLLTFAVSLVLFFTWTAGEAGMQFQEIIPGTRAGISATTLGRRCQPGAGAADDLPHAAGAALLLGGGVRQAQGLSGPHAAAGDGHAGRLRGAGSGTVLRLLRGQPDPDVLPGRALGRPRRIYAALKFFIFTAFGSAFLLAGIIALGFLSTREQTGQLSFDLLKLTEVGVPLGAQTWLFFAFALAFAIKVPIFPFHTWLPDAHVEAPQAARSSLAGVLLKMGTYGFVRFSLPLFPSRR